MAWSPKRSVKEVGALLVAPGAPLEVQTRLIDGRLQRVYVNQWPSLRAFWLSSAPKHKDSVYLVYQNQRYTFSEVHVRATKAASLLRHVYGVRKGDRVGICARNYPEYMVAFWACHFIGAVSVLVNAWSPTDVLKHCFVHTQCKVVIVDAERADRLEPIASSLVDKGVAGICVLEAHEGKGHWNGMQTWNDSLDAYTGPLDAITADPEIQPEDNASVYFTSGTTGLPKGVLSTHRQYLTNVMNLSVGSARAALRRGETPVSSLGPQIGILISVPLFHVTGSTSLAMLATFSGMKIVLMRKWVPEEAVRLIKLENIMVAGGVPSMVSDLVDYSDGQPLGALMFGGAPAPNNLPSRALAAFPGAALSQGYGLTETNSLAVSVAGEDYAARPTTCGLASPVNDLVIVNDGVSVAAGVIGEVWIRGPNVMKGYWGDPETTRKAITKDGWFRTGDLGYLDEEGFLYIRDRIKDIIIRGGENIDSVTVENALYADERVLEVAAVSVPDKRLGELVAAVVSIKPRHRDRVTEAELLAKAKTLLPIFAVPVIIVIQKEPFDRTPSGKILKPQLREIAREAWRVRLGTVGVPSSAKL
ncbi:long-chain-fatty-acid-CoA ligase [Coprinopsis marcescibilis]|uniref:Long-chain-fatty-acid-CoA ligase n=1 Tax=Coprinopsis marcescibilis TaxID=230819 RepID=A0A5C3L7N3_COPMA|nr:long-chain-fatty-acid-CoA ligase [Coprinopsis marcescibilis]